MFLAAPTQHNVIADSLDNHAQGIAIQVRALAGIAGQIISMSLALGPITRLMTRAMYRSIETRSSWSDSLLIPDCVINELKFWQSNLDSYNGFSIKHQHTPSRIVYSDASDTGYGGFVVGFPHLRVNGLWSKEEKLQSSTWRELAAVNKILSNLGGELAHEKVRWYSDNTIPRIIEHGSVKPHLHVLALSIFSLLLKHNIVLLPEWVPRCMNSIADKISRVSDYDDWAIHQSDFDFIDSLWGPHTFDRFASPSSLKLAKFNSRFWCRGSAGVDAVCYSWAGENNYMCPPISLIVHTLKQLRKCRGYGTLIVPKWHAAYFWPFICPDGVHLDTSVQDWRLLNLSFIPPHITPNSVFNSMPNFLTLALRIDHRCLPRRSIRGFCCSDLGHCQLCV